MASYRCSLLDRQILQDFIIDVIELLLLNRLLDGHAFQEGCKHFICHSEPERSRKPGESKT